jgi:hypothetical protein
LLEFSLNYKEISGKELEIANATDC